MTTWRNSLEAADERWLRRCVPRKPSLAPGETPDLKHCLAVLRAQRGHGFPHSEEARR